MLCLQGPSLREKVRKAAEDRRARFCRFLAWGLGRVTSPKPVGVVSCQAQLHKHPGVRRCD